MSCLRRSRVVICMVRSKDAPVCPATAACCFYFENILFARRSHDPCNFFRLFSVKIPLNCLILVIAVFLHHASRPLILRNSVRIFKEKSNNVLRISGPSSSSALPSCGAVTHCECARPPHATRRHQPWRLMTAATQLSASTRFCLSSFRCMPTGL